MPVFRAPRLSAHRILLQPPRLLDANDLRLSASSQNEWFPPFGINANVAWHAWAWAARFPPHHSSAAKGSPVRTAAADVTSLSPVSLRSWVLLIMASSFSRSASPFRCQLPTLTGSRWLRAHRSSTQSSQAKSSQTKPSQAKPRHAE